MSRCVCNFFSNEECQFTPIFFLVSKNANRDGALKKKNSLREGKKGTFLREDFDWNSVCLFTKVHSQADFFPQTHLETFPWSLVFQEKHFLSWQDVCLFTKHSTFHFLLWHGVKISKVMFRMLSNYSNNLETLSSFLKNKADKAFELYKKSVLWVSIE